MWISILIWVLAFLFVLALFVLFATFTLNVGYLEKKLYIAVYIFKIKVFSSHKEPKEKGDRKDEDKKDYKERLEEISRWKDIFESKKSKIKRLLDMARERIDVKTYSIFFDIGVGNAMATGLACGAASAFLGMLQKFIDDILEIYNNSHVRVTPVYNKYLFDIGCNVVINFKVVRLLKLRREIKRARLMPKELFNG